MPRQVEYLAHHPRGRFYQVGVCRESKVLACVEARGKVAACTAHSGSHQLSRYERSTTLGAIQKATLIEHMLEYLLQRLPAWVSQKTVQPIVGLVIFKTSCSPGSHSS